MTLMDCFLYELFPRGDQASFDVFMSVLKKSKPFKAIIMCRGLVEGLIFSGGLAGLLPISGADTSGSRRDCKNDLRSSGGVHTAPLVFLQASSRGRLLRPVPADDPLSGALRRLPNILDSALNLRNASDKAEPEPGRKQTCPDRRGSAR